MCSLGGETPSPWTEQKCVGRSKYQRRILETHKEMKNSMGPLILQSITMLFILIQDLKMQSRLALKACLSSRLSLPIAGTTGTRHHTSQSFKQYSKLVATFSLIKHAITRTDWQMMKGIQKRNQPRQQQPRLPPAPVHWRVCTAYPFCVLDGQLKSLTG